MFEFLAIRFQFLVNTKNHIHSQISQLLTYDLRLKTNNLKLSDERNFGWSAAPEVIPVPLLPSGPGGVRGTSLHRARSSTLRHLRPFPASAEKSLAQRLRPSQIARHRHSFCRSRNSRAPQDFGFAAGASGGCTSDGFT